MGHPSQTDHVAVPVQRLHFAIPLEDRWYESKLLELGGAGIGAVLLDHLGGQLGAERDRPRGARKGSTRGGGRGCVEDLLEQVRTAASGCRKQVGQYLLFKEEVFQLPIQGKGLAAPLASYSPSSSLLRAGLLMLNCFSSPTYDDGGMKRMAN